MRKIYFLFAILFFSLNKVNAQIDKGKKLLMGNVGVTIYKNENKNGIDTQTSRLFYILISPGFGKAIKNNLVLGYRVSVGLNRGRNESASMNSKENQWVAGGGIFLRRYFPLGKSFSFSADIGANFFHTDNESETNATITTVFTSQSNEFNLGISSALVYTFNKKWMANLSLNDFAIFYIRKQNAETKIAGTTTKQEYSQVGFESQINYGRTLSGLTLGFTYIW